MDYVNFYYTNVVGSYPFDTDRESNITRSTIEYLEDNDFSEDEICKIILDCVGTKFLLPSDLPDSIYKNSLIERDHFYFHKALRNYSAPPVKDMKTGKKIVSDFYLEMKIRFTIHDLLTYFQNVSRIKPEFIDMPRFKGQFESMLNRFNKMDKDVEGLDLLLYLIDSNAYNHCTVFQPFDLNRPDLLGNEVIKLSSERKEARLHHLDMVVWRMTKWMKH